MRLRHALLATTLGAFAAPASALAVWTSPIAVGSDSDANPIAQGAFGGSVLTGWLDPTVSLARRNGDGFGAPAPITVADPFEKVWESGLADDGEAIVITRRDHKPTVRIRATLVSPGGSRFGPVTISDRSHSAVQPTLDVAPDGTAVAAWNWHDKAGWRVQVAIRRPGQARFDKPQLLSPPGPTLGRRQVRPWIHVAAGRDGRGVVTWQIGGDYMLPESHLHVLTAGTDSQFGADQELAGAGGLADVALAVSPAGAVQVAYLDMHYSGHEGTSSLHVSQGQAGAPLSDPVVLSKGGKGTSSGSQVGTSFNDDGIVTVAWARPGSSYENGGPLEVFTRLPGGGFGPAQTLGDGAQGVALAAGPGDSAVLSWMQSTMVNKRIHWTVDASTRPRAGGPFGPAQAISAPERNALWPSVAITPAGDALSVFVTNTDGSGGGIPTAAIHRAD